MFPLVYLYTFLDGFWSPRFSREEILFTKFVTEKFVFLDEKPLWVPGRPEFKMILYWKILNPNALKILPSTNRYPKNGQQNRYTIFSSYLLVNKKNSIYLDIYAYCFIFTWWTNRQWELKHWRPRRQGRRLEKKWI